MQRVINVRESQVIQSLKGFQEWFERSYVKRKLNNNDEYPSYYGKWALELKRK